MEQAPKGGIGILHQRHIRELSRLLQRIETYKPRMVSMAFMKKIEVLSNRRLIIAVLFHVEIVSLCVLPKTSVEIEIVSTWFS